MKESKTKLAFISFLFLLFLGRLMTFSSLDLPDQAQIRFRGRVSRQPYLKGSNQIIFVDQLLIKTSRFPSFFYGQELVVVGKLNKTVLNPLQAQYSLNYPAIQVIENKHGLFKRTSFPQLLFLFRQRLEKVFSQSLNEPQSNLLAGILLGVKREMPPDFYQNLQKTGTLHIIVASGYNITVVAGFCLQVFLRFLRRKTALLLTLLVAGGYILMAGAEPPLVRAGLMAGLAFGAQAFGREQDGWLTLLWTGFLMLLVKPVLLFDIGFQLSFSATAGLILLVPLFESFLNGFWEKIFLARSQSLPGALPGRGFLSGELATTLSAQVMTLPWLLYHFGEVSWLAPVINGFVLPIVPLVMVLGALAAFSGVIFLPLGMIISWLAWPLLTYFVELIKFLGGIPWLSFKVKPVSLAWVFGYYCLLYLYLLWRRKKGKSLSQA